MVNVNNLMEGITLINGKLYLILHMVERSKDWIDEAEGDLEHAKSDMERGYYNGHAFQLIVALKKQLKLFSKRWELKLGGILLLTFC